MVPVTAAGVAAAGVNTVGGALVTVTVARPTTDPLVAVILADPTPAGLVYIPLALIEPTPLVLAHLIFSGVASPLPNWSFSVAVNCWVWFS